MKRTVTAHMEIHLYSEAELIFSVAAAQDSNFVDESFDIKLDGKPVEPREIAGRHGARLHTVEAGAGRLMFDYSAEVEGNHAAPEVTELDLIEYRRPSRYCESDTLRPTARAEFKGLSGKSLLDAVTSWVGEKLAYVPGASGPTDGAVATLLAREGVCRDYAHLVIAMLRGLDVPARLVSVYAPGLRPMDFHAVPEAYIEGAWHVVDPTRLAPRQSLLRIATGQDASETAFLTNRGGRLDLLALWVTALVDDFRTDDLDKLVTLG